MSIDSLLHRRSEHAAELDAITGQITTTEAAIDRYLAAFENGTLDERTCGHRIRDLTAKLGQLTARRNDLTELIHARPAPPSAEAIDQLRRDLAQVLKHGTPGQRKVVIEKHIAEIKIQGTLLIPIYKIPTDDEGPANTAADPRFRTTVNVVDLRGRLSRHEIRSKVDELARLIADFKIESEPVPPLPGHRRRWWALSDRLDEATGRYLLEDRQAGMTQKALAAKYSISLSSVQRVLRAAPVSIRTWHKLPQSPQ